MRIKFLESFLELHSNLVCELFIIFIIIFYYHHHYYQHIYQLSAFIHTDFIHMIIIIYVSLSRPYVSLLLRA